MPGDDAARDGTSEGTRVRARLADKPIPRKWRRAGAADHWRKEELEKKNKSKYHHLKFVEKKKIARMMKTTRRLLEAAQSNDREEDATQLRKLLKVQLRDFEYVQYYPKHLPYNALFPAEDSEASRRRRDEIRKMIRASVAKNGDERVIDVLQEEELDYSAMKEAAASVSASVGATPVPKSGREKWLAKRERKLRAKARKAEQKDGSDDVEDAAVDAAPATAKRKKQKAAQPGESLPEEEDTTVDRGPSKKKEKRASKVQEEPAAETIESEEVKPKGKKRKTAEEEAPPSKTEEPGRHPSWNAVKKPELSGALVKGTGARTTFNSDSED